MSNRSSATVRRWAAAMLVAGMGVVGNASATLIDRGSGLIYDDVLNITWLQDASYAQTSGFDADGLMTWDNAKAWAAGLNYFDSVRNVTWTDWRLAAINLTSPVATVHECGSGTAAACAASGDELGYMYWYDLGGTGNDKTGSQTSVLGGVTLINIQQFNWSGTELNNFNAWHFRATNGGQGDIGKDFELSAWAVRPGDVAAAVPEPETYALVLGGLGLLVFVARRRKDPSAPA